MNSGSLWLRAAWALTQQKAGYKISELVNENTEVLNYGEKYIRTGDGVMSGKGAQLCNSLQEEKVWKKKELKSIHPLSTENN